MADEYILRSIAIAKLTALEVTDPFATIADAKRVLADMAAADVAPVVHGKWGDNSFEKIKGWLGEAEALAQLAEECAELAQAALKLRRALDGKNPTPNTAEERRRALIEEYTDVIHCALVLDLEMDLDQIRKKTERWMRRLGVEENVGQ